MSEDLTRRELLGRSGRALASAGLGWAAARAAAQPARTRARRVLGANDRILMALIGCGWMGRTNLDIFMQHEDVEVVALCDVDANHLDEAAAAVEARYGRRPQTYKDFRAALDLPAVDAVVIATPDHWHALPFILACEAGKDVYCEKPLAHDIREGRAMVNAAKRYGTVVQVGTWQRSTQHFVDAIDYVRSGALGRISVGRAWVLGGAGVGRQPPQAPPPHLDWDFWLGPAAWTDYRPNRCHRSFRWFFNTGGGMTTDWGVHMLDILLLATGSWHPTRVASFGGKHVSGPDDDRDTPDTQVAVFDFPGFTVHWEVHVGWPGLDGGGDHGVMLIGTEGVLRVDRGGWVLWDKQGNEMPRPPSPQPVKEHRRNFLDCVRSRQQPRSDVETMHFTTTACHLANLAYRTGSSLDWDAAAEVITNDRSLMEDPCYRRPYRQPWTLPLHQAPGQPIIR